MSEVSPIPVVPLEAYRRRLHTAPLAVIVAEEWRERHPTPEIAEQLHHKGIPTVVWVPFASTGATGALETHVQQLHQTLRPYTHWCLVEDALYPAWVVATLVAQMRRDPTVRVFVWHHPAGREGVLTEWVR